jgi:hypothetical protein
MSQFTKRKAYEPVTEAEKHKLLTHLHSYYGFNECNELDNFVDSLCHRTAWEFGEDEPDELGYTPLVAAYLAKHWPDFGDEMRDIAIFLWFARMDRPKTESAIYFLFQDRRDHLLAIWVFARDPFLKQSAEKLDECVADIANTQDWERPDKISKMADEPINKFPGWILSEWIGTHLKYYRRKMIEDEQQAKKKEEEKRRASMRPPGLNDPDGPGM